ncbi:MAG: hypothetical protein PWR01_1679 [Clostridiales bacterium]|jgi:NAD(P)H dehydrogenase (quinone)|nr:hypothetical protein [Clostridiales bacterium]
MEKVKLAVIFYSMTGINYQMARWAAQAGQEAGAEVRLLKVRELAPPEVIAKNKAWQETVEATKDIKEATSEDIEWADAIIFSAPTRFGTIPAQLKQFIDIQGGLWAQGKLTNKVVSAISSAQNPHGGQEGTVKEIYTCMMHWGAIIVPPGYTDDSVFTAGGNPYGTTVTQGEDGKMVEDVKQAVFHQARRTVQVAEWIKKGKNS